VGVPRAAVSVPRLAVAAVLVRVGVATPAAATTATVAAVVRAARRAVFVVAVAVARVATMRQQQPNRSLAFPVQHAGQQPAAARSVALGFGPELTAQPLGPGRPIVRRGRRLEQQLACSTVGTVER